MSFGEFSNLSFFFGQHHFKIISVLCNFEECAEAPGILVLLAFESSFGSHFRCALLPCHQREHWHAQGGGTVHDPLSLLSRIASSHLDYLLPPPISSYFPSLPRSNLLPPSQMVSMRRPARNISSGRGPSRPSAHRPSSDITKLDRCSIIKSYHPFNQPLQSN